MGKGVFEIATIGIETGRATFSAGVSGVSECISRLFLPKTSSFKTIELDSYCEADSCTIDNGGKLHY